MCQKFLPLKAEWYSILRTYCAFFSRLSVDACIASAFWPLWMLLLQTWLYKYLLVPMLSPLLDIYLIHIFSLIYATSTPFNCLPVHPSNVYGVPTMCQGGVMLDSIEILETVLPGGIQREINSKVLGDLTIQPKKSQLLRYIWVLV